MLANFSLFSLAEFSFSLDKTFLLLTVGLVLSVEESESLKKVSLSSKRILGSSEDDSDSISEGSMGEGVGMDQKMDQTEFSQQKNMQINIFKIKFIIIKIRTFKM